MLQTGNLSQTLQGTRYFGIPPAVSFGIKRRSKPNFVCICKMGRQDKITEPFFISHGTRMTAIEESLPARQFFQQRKVKVCSKKSKSILVISAHWETVVTAVNAVDQADLIHGHSGFPLPSFYQLKCPAPGAPDLANRVLELLTESGFKCVIDKNRGLDHGSWIPLMLMYPEAYIPVCQFCAATLRQTTPLKLGKSYGPS